MQKTNKELLSEVISEQIQLGEKLFLKGKIKEALCSFESALKIDPDNVSALNDKGVVLNKLGDYEGAIKSFSEVIKREKNHQSAIFNLISNNISLGNLKNAEEILDLHGQVLPKQDIDTMKNELQKLKSPHSQDIVREVKISLTSKNRIIKFSISLDLSQLSQKMMWENISNNRLYEQETSRLFLEMLEEGDTFIDIGAHVGYFSLLTAATVGESGRVFSFEPELSNFKNLQNNIHKNNFHHVHLNNMAVGSKDGDSIFYINSDNDGGHALWDVGLHPFNEKSRSEKIKTNIKVVSLDNFFKDHELDKLKLIKIDTEGTEHSIIKGGTGIITKYRIPYIICEINRIGLMHMGTDENNLRTLLGELGYKSYLLCSTPEGAKIIKLELDSKVKSDMVFNILFAHQDAKLTNQLENEAT